MVRVKKVTALAYVHGRAGGVLGVDRTDKKRDGQSFWKGH